MIAVSYGHVEVKFPYISDDATHVPEANIFAQLLNLTAAIRELTKQIKQIMPDQ